MHDLANTIPTRLNAGSWLTHFTFNELENRIHREPMVLPICSLGTPREDLEGLAPLVLPPLYHEALGSELKSSILARISDCFPYYLGTRKRAAFSGKFDVVELPAQPREPPAHGKLAADRGPRILAFSVDTAVEQHGPHLPLATDTIQSYAVLQALARETDDLALGPPVDYGHLTWGLPYGLSIDITPPLLTRYVTGFANAVLEWARPQALYVVDVHGSIVHRQAIEAGLAASKARHWRFRWLHEPLVEFAGRRGDQHAGGVETALIRHINPDLVDARWWPGRVNELAANEMPLELAAELSADLPRFIRHAENGSWNGIVGKVLNFFELDAGDLMRRMLAVAREDVEALSQEALSRNSG